MDRLKSVPYKLWRRRSGNSQISDQNPPTLSSPTEDDDIFEEERSPLELATEENAHLQATVIKLTQDLESLQNSHLSLESKVDDLDQKLQLERRRVEWQKRFYEKKIVDVAMGVFSSSDNDHGRCDPDHLLASLSHDFYKETILELVAEQERKDGQIQDMKSSFEEEIKRLQTRQEADLADTVEAHFLQVQQLTQGQEELIRDLLSGCEQGLFKEMREEYLIASERNVELKTTNGNKIWVQFSKFSSQKKGIIIAVISIVTVATAGWASWGFITWVWPRLIIFADSVLANPQTLSVWMTYLVELLNSPQFQTFVLAWEQGQPVMNCLKPFLNTALLASALQLAPNFLSQLKKRKSGNTATF